MKKKYLLIIPIVLILLLTGCKEKETDAQKFANEYKTISEYNYYVYKNAEEIIKILEHGTGAVYLGFPECPWCGAYVPMLNEVADTYGLEKIYYYNILEARQNNTEDYQKIVSILNNHLRYDDEGNKRIFVPAVIFVQNGEIIGFDDETSYDTKGLETPEEYWTDEEKKDLKNKLSSYISTIVDNSCTDCNK